MRNSSTAITVSADGTKAAEMRYMPWGEQRYASGTTPTSFRFTGQRQESSLGLYFYGARWYDPALGRFTSPDTIIPQQQGVQAWDRYAYTNNNPVKYTDPSGYSVDCAMGEENCEAGVYVEPENDVVDGPPTTLPDPSSAATEEELNWLETILAPKETPLVMATIQVLATDGFPLIAGITGGIGPEDLVVALACAVASRGAAVLGTVSTLYQYRNNLHGAQMTDAVESVVTTIGGFIPFAPVYITSVHVNFFYTAYRYFGGELPSIFP